MRQHEKNIQLELASGIKKEYVPLARRSVQVNKGLGLVMMESAEATVEGSCSPMI